ncbi:MAG: alpha/beta hydrolase [Acidimicrobiales bacterium]
METVELRGESGLRLAADAYGPPDGPPALFLHGLGQSRQSWGMAAARLGEQGWRAYALDLRGHGDSARPVESAYQHSDVGLDVLALCADLSEPPLVVGASMGGAGSLFAQGVADHQLFRGLVLVDITPDVDMEGGRRIIAFMSAHPDGYPDLETAADAIGAYRGGQGKPSPSGLTRVLRQGEDGRWRWHWDPRILDVRKVWLDDPALADAYAEQMRAGMSRGADRLESPVLLVRGGSSDVVTVEAAQALLRMIPHARYVDVAEATHMVAGDRNDAFAAAVLEFAEPLLRDARGG